MMTMKIKYKLMLCIDCDFEFMIRPIKTHRKYCCPVCGDNFTEYQMNVWLDQYVRHRRPWTDEEDENIITSANAGYSTQAISDSLPGRSVGAINKRINTLRKSGIKIADRKGKVARKTYKKST